MGFVKEFKDFAMQGNMVDLAVGVIIGAAFGKIVTSLVEDVITPLLLAPALKAAGVDNLDKLQSGGVFYGKFLAAILAFIVIAFVLFLIIKAVNSAKKKQAAEAPAAPPADITLLTEIRDALRK
jgi:large conductance mechanosensitive channel